MRSVAIWTAFLLLIPGQPSAQDVSVERGELVSIVAGCHFCHTEGYRESEGTIDPEKALRGNRVGWQGPWGTSYAGNLRLLAADLSEDGFVTYLKTLRLLPPMPWYQVRQLPETDKRALYRYIVSLGYPGDKRDVITPAYVPPGEKPRTAFVILDPPQAPPPCTRDFDCGVGEICSIDEPRLCVARQPEGSK